MFGRKQINENMVVPLNVISLALPVYVVRRGRKLGDQIALYLCLCDSWEAVDLNRTKFSGCRTLETRKTRLRSGLRLQWVALPIATGEGMRSNQSSYRMEEIKRRHLSLLLLNIECVHEIQWLLTYTYYLTQQLLLCKVYSQWKQNKLQSASVSIRLTQSYPLQHVMIVIVFISLLALWTRGVAVPEKMYCAAITGVVTTVFQTTGSDDPHRQTNFRTYRPANRPYATLLRP